MGLTFIEMYALLSLSVENSKVPFATQPRELQERVFDCVKSGVKDFVLASKDSTA